MKNREELRDGMIEAGCHMGITVDHGFALSFFCVCVVSALAGCYGLSVYQYL